MSGMIRAPCSRLRGNPIAFAGSTRQAILEACHHRNKHDIHEPTTSACHGRSRRNGAALGMEMFHPLVEIVHHGTRRVFLFFSFHYVFIFFIHSFTHHSFMLFLSFFLSVFFLSLFLSLSRSLSAKAEHACASTSLVGTLHS